MATAMEHLTMFIVVRKDLAKSLNWPTGSVITQACHATSAILHLTRDQDNTKQYIGDFENMHKVVLETKNLNSLEKLATILEKNQVPFHKWIEQPENIPTCIATAPLKERNAEVLEAFKKGCSLYR